jgi:succinate-semialdehyde dehydrogenase / glutarate-semialdehyde dehydrogenase
MFEAINPATGQTIATYEPHPWDVVDERLARSWSAWTSWRDAPVEERGALLVEVAAELDKRRSELAELIVMEMGKPIGSAEAEVDKCAWVCRYEADHGPEHLAPEPVESDATRSYVRFDPLGPLLAIMPWNFPLWQAFRALAPAVVAGNPVLLKHASNVPGCALAIEQVLTSAGAPEGLFQTLLIGSGAVEGVITDDRVRCVTITGSVEAGRQVAGTAGHQLKPTVLELGGSDAFVVLEDADVAATARAATDARLLNSGQSCISAKRFIVVDEVADAFAEAFVTEMEARTVGDPMDRETDVGPLARDDLRSDLHEQVERTVAEGGRLLSGGQSLDRPGFYYAPTVLDEVTPVMAAGAEETFGPVAAILRIPHEEAAIATANASTFGLGASVWTGDPGRGERVAAQLEAGTVTINEIVKSDPRLPFGGVKDSGYGRELGSFGTRSFTNIKTVWVA